MPPLLVWSTSPHLSLQKLVLFTFTFWDEGWFGKMKALPPAFLDLFSLWLYSLPPLLALLFLRTVFTQVGELEWKSGDWARAHQHMHKIPLFHWTQYLTCTSKGRVDKRVSPSTSFIDSVHEQVPINSWTRRSLEFFCYFFPKLYS